MEDTRRKEIDRQVEISVERSKRISKLERLITKLEGALGSARGSLKIALRHQAREPEITVEELLEAHGTEMPEPEDHTDDICPTCNDPDCSRPWGHPIPA